jgi:hypothetical protein
VARRSTASRDAARLTRSAVEAAATAARSAELAMASAQVVAARLALMGGAPAVAGVDAAAEIARMTPEKIEAFTAAGAAMAGHMGTMAARGARAIADEGAHAVQACADLAAARSPMEVALAQGRYLTAMLARASTGAVAMTALATRLQADALSPIHRTATANARRLGRR